MYCVYTSPLISQKNFLEGMVFGKLVGKLNIIILH